MVEPCFNELSIFPLCSTKEEVKKRVATFISLLQKLEELGIKRTRYEDHFSDIKLCEKYSLAEFCNCPVNRKERDFLYSHMRRPYLDQNNEQLFYKYLNCKFIANDNKKVDCLGLYVAHVTRSFSVGFNAGLFEGDKCIKCTLQLSDKNGQFNNSTICHLTLPDHINKDNFIELMLQQEDISVPSSDTKPEAKKIHIPDHHGQKECREHANQLAKCKYVKEILNTIDFAKPGGKYIDSIEGINIIKIRLNGTKCGYGLCISTTAVNKVQNHWIAKHLEEKFGR